MSDLSAWLATFENTVTEALQTIGSYLPYLTAAAVLLLVGWFVARLLRVGFIKLGRGVNRFLSRFGSRAARPQLSPPILSVVGNVVFWSVMLLFAAMAARLGRLDVFTSWLDRIVAYLPTLVAGGLIALAGYLVSTLVRDIVSAAAASTGSAQSELFGFVAQSAVFLTAVVIGLDQIGIDVTFLIILLGIVVGGVLLSLAIAFGFGARVFVSNLIGAQQLQRLLEPGQVAQIGDIEGQVLEITPTSVVLLTSRGRFTVPAKLFQEQAALILSGRDDG